MTTEFFYLNKMFRSQDIYIFEFLGNLQTSKSVISSLTLLYIRSYTFDCFFRILGSIWTKFGQIFVRLMTNVSNYILPQLWRLKTISKPFYDFDKTIIWWVLKCFSRWCSSFLVDSAHIFKKVKKQKVIKSSFWIFCGRLVN